MATEPRYFPTSSGADSQAETSKSSLETPANQGPTLVSDHQDELLRLEIQQSAVPMWIFDQAALRFLDVNDAAIERYGFGRQEFLQTLTLLDIRPTEDIPIFLRSACLHPHATPDPTVFRHRTKYGVVFDVAITSREVVFRGKNCEIVTAMPHKSESI